VLTNGVNIPRMIPVFDVKVVIHMMKKRANAPSDPVLRVIVSYVERKGVIFVKIHMVLLKEEEIARVVNAQCSIQLAQNARKIKVV